MHICVMSRQINIEIDFLYQLDKVDLFRGDNVANVGVDGDVLVVDLEILELYLAVLLVQRVLLGQLEVHAWSSLA